MANKWIPDSDGVFRCPECDFETRGNGLVIGAHIRAKHKELWKLIVKEGAESVMQAAREARGNKRRPLELVQPGAQNAAEVLDDMVTDVVTLTRPTRPTATEVASAIMNLPQVAALTGKQLHELMEHICAIKKIDDESSETIAQRPSIKAAFARTFGGKDDIAEQELVHEARGNGRRELQEVH